MDVESKESVNCIGRRGFIRSLFGLTAASEAKAKRAPEAPTGEWFWSNIRTGQVGFPTGLTLRQHRPGSIMKIVASAAFLEQGLVSPIETVDCTGEITLKNLSFSCQVPHGRINLEHALAKSCNVFFATISTRLNCHLFGQYAELFGLSRGVARRPSGLFPAKFEDQSLNYVLGLAPDLQPNALQLLRLSALVGTRGMLPSMHSAEDSDINEASFDLKFSENTWTQLSSGMRLCVREGTAANLDPNDVLNIAAKTGTAQHGKIFQSWITGYFPFDNPRHAFCVWSPNGTSQTAAVPLARKVLLSTSW
jgi:penicillin-binding protein 2